ncbi:MAG: zinc ribbon domain-containing protein [Cyanobacteria bacterium SIG30]|nr:zinc ribbon domain-containing protein [Cyanobacteria bacterium SIG30]
MNLMDYILNRMSNKCTHRNALLHSDEGYCPDCGVYLKKYYYVVRCAHCNIKREGKISLDLIKPSTNFCPNCGGEDFYIERCEKIDITDINYAIQIKEVVKNENLEDTVQIWVENIENRKRLRLKNA